MKEVQLNHPLITHKLALLRDKNTGTKEFREIITEIAVLLCYEATKDAKLKKAVIETPLENKGSGLQSLIMIELFQILYLEVHLNLMQYLS